MEVRRRVGKIAGESQVSASPPPKIPNICHFNSLITDPCSVPTKIRERLSGELGLSRVIPDTFASVPALKYHRKQHFLMRLQHF